ncbi:MAG TPA: FMN-binding protein, partial [Azospira sp.]|nr:FMN-binding protein [Azospira sp.]
VAGVRVTQHKETPGLGDYVEPKKDKNKERPWITQFNGLSLATLAEKEWKVKKDGGHFDSNAGAPVTPRAVVKAVRKAVVFVEAHRDELFAKADQQDKH